MPEWDQILATAVRLQQILPGATVVGGTAAAYYAQHRRSLDVDTIIFQLASQFDQVAAQIEEAAGWVSARSVRPVQLMGSLDGIPTTVRNLIRAVPLETVVVQTKHGPVTLPTRGEIMRIKAYLATIRRNTVRDYLDTAALAAGMSDAEILDALSHMDRLYPQPNDPAGARSQVMRNLANPQPSDLAETDLSQYKDLQPPWNDWRAVVTQCRRVANLMASAVATRRAGWTNIKAR